MVAGRTSGLCELGDEVTWEARHLGVKQRLSINIVAMRSPDFFQDRMIKGAFAFFEHDHLFEETPDGTKMIDVLRFKAPLGPLGWIAEKLVLNRHLHKFLSDRALSLKAMAQEKSGYLETARL